MSAGASLAFPGSRTLGAWWRQLAGYQPDGMWIGYHIIHHLTAPVLVLRQQKLPPFELFVLKALALGAPAGPAALSGLVHLDAALIGQVLAHLDREGLVTLQQGGLAVLNAAGRHAALHGEYPRAGRERRTLHFWHADWTSPPSSHFVHVPQPDRITWLPAPPTLFAVDELRACLRQSDQWRGRHAFPMEIRDVLAKPLGEPTVAWDHVMVATPQRWFAVVLRTRGDDGPEWQGFAVNSRNWELNAAQPAIRVPNDASGWFPPPLGDNVVRQAFVEWCQQRQIAAAETEHCALKIEGSRLLVEASAWRERLPSHRGDFWLLAGEGAVRTALRMDFT